MGQFCLGACKRQPYDTDLRVPFLLRGPGIAAAQHIASVAGIADVAPTLLELAGVPAGGLTIDGRSLVPLLAASEAASAAVVRARASWRDAYLVEYFATQEGVKSSAGHILDAGNNTFRGLRIIGSGSGSPHLEHFESAWWWGDLAYFEFTDVEADWGFERPSFFELYDMLSDPAQLHNVYAAAPIALRDNLAARVRAQYGCIASACS